MEKRKWGNSNLAINHRYWKCSYCGLLIKDNIPFLIIRINGDETPYDLCSPTCLELQVVKSEARHYEKEK